MTSVRVQRLNLYCPQIVNEMTSLISKFKLLMYIYLKYKENFTYTEPDHY